MVGQGVSSNQLKFMDFSFMYFVQTAWINKIWISRMKNPNVVNFKMDVIVFSARSATKWRDMENSSHLIFFVFSATESFIRNV